MKILFFSSLFSYLRNILFDQKSQFHSVKKLHTEVKQTDTDTQTLQPTDRIGLVANLVKMEQLKIKKNQNCTKYIKEKKVVSEFILGVFCTLLVFIYSCSIFTKLATMPILSVGCIVCVSVSVCSVCNFLTECN